MIVYRLTKKKFKEDLSGIGAQINGGRWNSKGYKMIYTGANIALCTAEVAVHLPLGILPKDYVLQTIKLPKIEMGVLDLSALPTLWNLFPYDLKTQKLGDGFIKGKKQLILQVPSAVVQGEYNYLINPEHSLMGKVEIIKIENFGFDQRLFWRG